MLKQAVKRSSLLLVMIAGMLAAGVNEWTSSGPWGGKAAWIYINNAGTIFTEISAGLYKSNDGGATWDYSYGGVAHDTRAAWCHNNYSAAFPNILYGGC